LFIFRFAHGSDLIAADRKRVPLKVGVDIPTREEIKVIVGACLSDFDTARNQQQQSEEIHISLTAKRETYRIALVCEPEPILSR